MPWKRPQVLGVDLNPSESSRPLACPRLSLPPPLANAAIAASRLAAWPMRWRAVFGLPEGKGPRHGLPTGAAAVLHDARATTAVRASY
jgi:hypothetical protein